MAEEQRAAGHSAALMIASRLVNMAVGLATIPILIRYLGGSGFAAWAVLLAASAGFSLLEMGMPTTAVRFLALSAGDGRDEGRRLFGRVWLLLAASFGAGLLLTHWLAAPLASWFGLPDTALMGSSDAIYWVLGAVAARAFLQNGVLSLFAARRFVWVSVISVVQPLCSNVAAMVTAWLSGRLDLTLIAYWTAQLLVLAVTFAMARSTCLPKFTRDTFDRRQLRELFFFGLSSQMEGWAQFVNFQFDKFIIAGLVGLWAVAPYEVANRSATALRSIPASGLETLLPAAVSRREKVDEAWDWYLSSTRVAAYGVCVFMIAPLAVAPLFLYAWTGEMGYVGRWVFVALMMGAVANVMAMPAATLAQAQGRPGLLGRAALVGIVVNVPLSLTLVLKWESVGAALGTGVAMFLSAAYLLVAVHRYLKRPLRETLRLLGSFWPLLLVCLLWGAATYLAFTAWFETLDTALRFSRWTRAQPGVIAAIVYALCLLNMLAVELHRGTLLPSERAWLGALRAAIRWRSGKPGAHRD